MKSRRKTVNCSRCNKYKLHFGKGMCSACLRRTKRENNPKFYLGTCYSELSRRCKTYDPLRPNYYTLNKCSKEEFFSKFLNNKLFLKLYKNWQDSKFKRKMSPTIDRIDNTKGYTIDNIRFIDHFENTGKDSRKKCAILKNDKIIKTFKSQRDLADYLNITPATVCKNIKLNKKYKNMEFICID